MAADLLTVIVITAQLEVIGEHAASREEQTHVSGRVHSSNISRFVLKKTSFFLSWAHRQWNWHFFCMRGQTYINRGDQEK